MDNRMVIRGISWLHVDSARKKMWKSQQYVVLYRVIFNIESLFHKLKTFENEIQGKS